MYVTLDGIVMEVKPEQPSKACTSILDTVLEIIEFLHPATNELLEVSMIALQSFLES